VLNPGRTGGALEFVQVLKKNGCITRVIVSEAETLIYASRSDGPAQARIFRIKESVPVAALPASCTGQVLEVLHTAYSQFIDGRAYYILVEQHGRDLPSALTLLNAGRIESTRGEFQFLHRWGHSICSERPGGVGQGAGHCGGFFRHPRPHCHGMAKNGL